MCIVKSLTCLGLLTTITLGSHVIGSRRAIVNVNTYHIANKVDDSFLSFTIDAIMFMPDVRWLKFNFSSPKLQTLMSSLSPAILRIGGSPANWLLFNKPARVLNVTHLKPQAIVMTTEDLDNLVDITLSTGNRLLLDLNLQLRYGTQWDPSNAIELFEYCSRRGYGKNIDWELGNEPEYYTDGEVQISADQVAADFAVLQRIIAKYNNLAHSRLVGPDNVGVTPGSDGLHILQAVINATGDTLRAATFHQYYFEGDIATYADYLNPKYFQSLADTINTVRSAVRRTKYPSMPIWIGETSDAWHSGTANVSDRFVSGFLWMDKLGLSAQMGVEVVMRQTFYGYDYAMLDVNMDPNPDYWLSYLHKVLVGPIVLPMNVSGNDVSLRVYAQCTAKQSGYSRGSVTVFALNISPDETRELSFDGDLSELASDIYLLSPAGPDGILSKHVNLNGKTLYMPSDTSMPQLIPVRLPAHTSLSLPPMTMMYCVFNDARAVACTAE